MNRAPIGKYLILVLFLSLLVGFWYWKAWYGITGGVRHLDFSTAGHIAFVRQEKDGRTNLFIVSAATPGEPKRLTDDAAGKRSPAWSPDGTHLCYSAEAREDRAPTFQIFLLGGGDPTPATRGSIGKDMPQWSPDGQHIAFLTGGAIKTVRPNGADMEQVYPPPVRGNAPGASGGEGGQPADESDAGAGMKLPPITSFRWAPRGLALAALQVVEGEAATPAGSGDWWLGGVDRSQEQDQASGMMEPESIIILPALGSKPLLLPRASANRVGFAWFPDGQRLAVALSTRHGRHAIGIWRADEPQLLPEMLFASEGYTIAPENPAISPDGSQIAFEVWRMDSAANRTALGIAVMPADASKPVRVARPADIATLPVAIKGQATNPRWSPDGKRLLYLVAGANGRDVWVANADGTNPVNLTKGQGDNFDAVWSPRAK